MAADDVFEAAVQTLQDDPRVTRVKMFGAPGLKVGGKVFACLFKGKLVVKLSQKRVEAIVASGAGERFDPGMGRRMKEWVALAPGGTGDWLSLMQESRDFVASGL